MSTSRRCALVTRFADSRVAESAQLLAEHLHRRGITVHALADEAVRLGALRAEFVTESALLAGTELVIAIGGDGTLLHAAGLVAGHDIPLLGINRGRLGFLTDVMPDAMLASVDAALDGLCSVDTRALLAAEFVAPDGERKRGLALNDVVVQKRQSGHLVDFETWIDDRFVNTHGGDGLIVATATGSTAYALSVGGPIVAPDLDVVVVAPICPHTLSDRPIVVSGRATIEVRLIDRHDSLAEVACDGHSQGTLAPGAALRIGPSSTRIRLLHPAGYDYFRLLRSKLNWGRRSFDGEHD
jgi:NAD+ kinase